MTRKLVWCAAGGEIVAETWSSEPLAEIQPPAPGLTGHEVEAEVRLGEQYIGPDGVLDLPPRPGSWAVWGGSAWIDPRSDAARAVDLDAARLAAVAAINALAGDARRRFVTDLPGQDALYLLKEAEARGWVASAAPTVAGFPLITAEIGITAPTGDEVAQVYLNLAALYVQAAARLERARLGHVAQAEAAADGDTAQAAVAAFAAALHELSI